MFQPKAYAFALLLPLAACSAPSVTAKIDAAVVGLTTAEQLATVCIKTMKVCQDPDTKQRIKDADMVAYNAVKAAEKNSALLGTAIDAVMKFQTSIPVAH